MLVDGRGIPLSIVVAGANINDHLLLERTLADAVAKKPTKNPYLASLGIPSQNLCLDKGYDCERVRVLLEGTDYNDHISCRGEEVVARRRGSRARRWVVEACHSWLNRFRKVLVRFEKLEASYLGLLQLACAIICFRRAGVLG